MLNWSVLQHKLRYSFNKVLPALYRNGYESKAKKIATCGHYKDLARCSTCGEIYLNGFNSCKDRFCPICEKKRSYLWLAKLSPIIDEYLKLGYVVNMFTLTIEGNQDLKKQLNILSQCWRVMTHEDKTIRKQFKQRFLGGFRALEVKRGSNKGLWHCHYHGLIIKDNRCKDFEWLKSSWEKAYRVVTDRNISLQVRVDAIHKNHKGYIGAILEVAKYVTKFDWSFNDDVKELITSLAGVRTTSTWGILRNRLSEKSIEDDMDLTLDETVKLVCKTCGNDVFDVIEGVTGNNVNVSDYLEDNYDYNEQQLDNMSNGVD